MAAVIGRDGRRDSGKNDRAGLWFVLLNALMVLPLRERLMSIFRAFWEELVAAYRAEKIGGQAAIDSRQHEAELRAELTAQLADIKDQLEVEGIARRWVKPKSEVERQAAR